MRRNTSPTSFAPFRALPGASAAICLAAASALLAPSSTQAAPIYWNGVGTGWNLTADWSTASGATTPNPVAVPGSGDDAIFNISTLNSAQTINLNAAQAALSLTFNNTGTTTIQTGTGTNSLTLGSGGLTKAAGSGAVTISSGLVIGANQTWTNNSTVSSGVTVSGNLSGSGNLNLNVSTSQKENGSFTLSGSNNSGYSGNISISNGRVATSNANSFGTGTVTVNSGAQAYFGQGVTFANNIVVSGTGYAGGTAQNYALRMDAGTILSGTVTVAGSANLSSHNRAATISGQITSTGAGDVTFIGSNGIITLSNGANNWAGTTTLNNQNLTLGADNVLPNGTTVTFASNAILDLASRSETVDLLSSTGTNGIIQNSTAASTGTLTLGGGAAASASFGGVIRNNGGTGGTVALTKIGSGTQTLTGTNTYTGGTRISAGTLALSSTGTIASGATSTITFDLNNTGSGLLSFANTGFAFTGTLSLNLATVTTPQTFTLFGGSAFDASDINLAGITNDAGLTFVNNSGVWTATAGSNTWTFASSAGTLSFTAVPEPHEFAVAVAALLGVVIIVRRRQRSMHS